MSGLSPISANFDPQRKSTMGSISTGGIGGPLSIAETLFRCVAQKQSFYIGLARRFADEMGNEGPRNIYGDIL
jgi:hypothetical protein